MPHHGYIGRGRRRRGKGEGWWPQGLGQEQDMNLETQNLLGQKSKKT